MNPLSVNLGRGGGSKSKNSIGFPPVVTPIVDVEDNCNKEIKTFINSSSTDDQLVILKHILDSHRSSNANYITTFLAVTFFHAESKHPVKCLISRQITKNIQLQSAFTEALAAHIASQVSSVPSDYKLYIDTVNTVASCIENFNTGVAAVRVVEVTLAEYLRNCLNCCVKTLSEKKTLSPTEKNEIFVIGHLTLRLLLHILQKGNPDNISKLILMFKSIRLLVQVLMYDDDVPMDTKTVCGILYLSMHVMENGEQSWISVLNSSNTESAILDLKNTEGVRLSLFSAIVTIVPAEQLVTLVVNSDPAIVTLTREILGIGDRSSSESTFVLSVSRTLLQISKLLEKISDGATGLTLVDSLLIFVWSHLEHYMDSVRHLSGQMLGCIIKYCAKMEKEGDGRALGRLWAGVRRLERERRSLYVGVSLLAAELGAARVLRVCPVRHVIAALDSQPVHNAASVALEALLTKLSSECNTEQLHAAWLQPLLAHAAGARDSCVLNVIEDLLVKAFTLNADVVKYVTPYIKQACETSSQKPRDLKCALMLLRVTRKSGVIDNLSDQTSENEWKGIISYDLLKQAAVDAVDETRILSLSLIVECPKSTEVFTEGELQFVLHYLKYNINAQAPNFRQLTLSVMKKFVKRFEESYKVIKRQNGPNGVSDKVDYYLRFIEQLRRQCFDSLIPGANYSRRLVALQIIVWCEKMNLDDYERHWEHEYVEKLLLHLEDSYENNKVFALDALQGCPADLLKSNTYSISLDINDIFAQASSLKPTDCVSAAYKLDLLRRRLPDYILQGEPCVAVEPVMFALVRRLAASAREQARACSQSVLLAAVRAPLHGVLHCLRHAAEHIHAQAISSDELWTSLVAEIISTCADVTAAVAGVVNNSSPEGHLPMDLTTLSDHGNTGNVTLDDGRQVTAQMVLLCAWRSVKEVSLLLGTICSRLTISGEEEPTGTLTVAQVEKIGEHFTTLLTETKHRGAFEQAHVGFMKLLLRLWRCRSPSLHSLPRRWLEQLLRALASGEEGSLCATRRSAGLPFMIQALAVSELQAAGAARGLQASMRAVLALAREGSGEARAHALNIARALVRHAALHDHVAPYVGQAVVVALAGFDARDWAERNSSTLLFSALMVRVFGVVRTRAHERLSARNRMTGRLFFSRYPLLYDYLLEKLQDASSEPALQELRPSLSPALLLLARLRPSALDGSAGNLKLTAFVPHVLACAGSGVLSTRQLAARAIVPLISPDLYIPHIQSMFKLVHDESIKRNFCHGVLLQLTRLLDGVPEAAGPRDLPACVEGALWALRQAAGHRPCFLIADELLKVINVFVWRFPVPQDTIIEILAILLRLVFVKNPVTICPGREVCLANATYLYFILATKSQHEHITDVVYKGLQHSSYEVVLSVLNYLLILHNVKEEDTDKFQEHLQEISNKSTLEDIRINKDYIPFLCKVLKNDCLECQQKSLRILTLEGNTQKYIIGDIEGKITDEIIIAKLLECLQNAHENLTHIYLESLLNFVTDRLRDSRLSEHVLLDVIRVVYECSSSDNSEDTRNVVVVFVETNISLLLKLASTAFNDADSFELSATLWATVVTLLEDDEASIRQRVSRALAADGSCGSRSARRLRRRLARGPHAAPLLAVLALLDFRSVVLAADDVSDECRVFDQNEKYNIFLEEAIWTIECADHIVQDCNVTDPTLPFIDNPTYKPTFDKLCNENVEAFKKMAAGIKLPKCDALNPKVELFVNRLRRQISNKIKQ